MLGVKKYKILIVEDDELQHLRFYGFLVLDICLVGEVEK
jgi:hypothetical protein